MNDFPDSIVKLIKTISNKDCRSILYLLYNNSMDFDKLLLNTGISKSNLEKILFELESTGLISNILSKNGNKIVSNYEMSILGKTLVDNLIGLYEG